MTDVKTVADAAADKLLSIYAQTESDGWEHYSASRGVTIERNKTTALHRWRAKGTIDAPLAAVMKAASHTESRPHWDPMCSGGKELEVLEKWTAEGGIEAVWWCFTGVLLLVSPRDMCMALTIKEVVPGKAWITCSTSMVHDKCPPIKGNVRGRAEVAGLYVERNAADPAGKTDVTYIAAVNPAGWLPTWAVNLGAGKGAYCIDFLRKYVLKGERGDWKADA
eukprot:gene194-7245_t